MRKTIVLNVLVFAVALSFNSCKDDEPTLSVKEYITSNNWKAKSITINPAYDWYHTGTAITDLMADWDDCIKDDLTIFETNGNLCMGSGAIKCEEDENEKVCSETYTLSEDGKTLTRSEWTGSTTIKAINGKQLILESYLIENSVTYTFREEYEAVSK